MALIFFGFDIAPESDEPASTDMVDVVNADIGNSISNIISVNIFVNCFIFIPPDINDKGFLKKRMWVKVFRNIF